MGILDDAEKAQATPQAAPASATPTPNAPQGSILDQAVTATGTPAVTPVTPAPESTVDRWTREAYEAIGKAVPQTSVAPMRGLQTHLLDKFRQSGQELGKIAENKVNTFLGAMDDEISSDMGEKRAEIPSYAKGLEGTYLRQKFETESPVLAGATGGLANLGGQILGDPTNWPFLAKGLAISVGSVSADALKPWAEKLMSKGFGLQMTAGVVSQLDELQGNWSKMSDYDKSHAISQIIAGTYMAQSAVREGFKGEPKVKAETPVTVGPEQGGEGPKTSTQTGTVQGEATKLRPTTRATAGVEAPVTAKAAATLEGEKPSILQRAAEQITSPASETQFGREQTAPAATRQAVSTVGQVAEDRIAQHNSIVNGEAAPEGITGTQTPSKFVGPDEAWQEMQKTAQDTTFRKADDISQREQKAWEAKRDEALQEYKDLVDRHNKNIDDYNAQVPKDQQMPHAVMNPAEVAVPERPLTYNELRSDVQKEQANAKSQDAAVREEAIKTSLPKAEKAMDNWFKQHSDEVSPAEYDSVKKLWADSERMKEIAMGLRGPLAKGNLTGNQMRQIEVSMNNRQLRRGQSPDAFQRLLGPDGYNNWQNVAKLFDTVKDPTLPEMFTSWGKYAAEYLVAGLIPHLTGLGVIGKWGMEKLMNHVMFDPEFGETFGRVTDWLKSQKGRVVDSITELPANLRDKLVGIIKSYKDAGERGAAGRGVKQGRTPQPEKFGRKGLGLATPEESQVAAHEKNGGSTFTPEGRNLTGADKYSVGAYPDRTQQLDNLTPETLKAFKDQNADLLNQPDHAVGTWKDNDTGKHVLDVAKLYGDRETAVAAGKAANQKAIYHLGGEGEIQTGGTGEKTPISDALAKKYGTTGDARQAAFVLPDGRMVALTGEHDQMVTNAATYLRMEDTLPKPTDANGQIGPREHLIQSENAIRTRYRQTKGGKEIVFSIPDKVTDAQAQQLRMAAAKVPNGSIVIEQGKPGGAYRQIDATPGNVQKALEELGAVKPQDIEALKAKVQAAQAEKAPEPPPQPVYIDRKNGMHEVVTGPASDRTGHLLAQDVPSEKEGEPSTEVRVASHWVAPEQRGKGFGAAQLETLAQSLSSDKTALLSDVPGKVTDSAKGAWKRLMSNYPLAVTEEADGSYRMDLEKMRAPATTKTTATVKGSTVELMKNPLPVKATSESDTPSTIDVATALNKYTKRNLGALQPGSEPAEMVARAKELAEDEARYQMTQNTSGTTWYTEQMDEHDAVAKEMRPELKDDTKLSLFKFAEAILSSGQKPYRNFTSTMEAWDHYTRDGKFPSTNPATGKSWGPRGIANYGNAFEAVNRLIEERGEKGAVDWMMSEHPVSELKQYNKNVSGKKTDMQHGVQILGAKRGPFAQNLHGQETAFTADMWISRTWNRWMGSIEVEPETGEIASDAPRNQQERALMKLSFSEVAQKLGLTTSSLQAVLWYYEQALYTAHGTPKESWSFSDAARRAQSEAKAKAAEPVAPSTEPLEGENPREREGRYRDKDTEFNPEDLE